MSACPLVADFTLAIGSRASRTAHARVKQNVIPSEGLHVRFDDGQTWSTGQSFRLPDAPEERKRLLEFLRRKTGKPITQARLLENVPGW